MKNARQCPKCESQEIVKVHRFGGWGNNIPSDVKITRYLCCACGFTEEWIESPADRKKLVALWSPIEEH